MLSLVTSLLPKRRGNFPSTVFSEADLPQAAAANPFLIRRKHLADKYLHGHGIEVGALNGALSLPKGTRVTYVDRMPMEELLKQYPNLAGQPLAPVHVVDDGERLPRFARAGQDFVIANHFLEHTQDPIGTLGAHLRVLKPGGILFLAVPNRHFTFDRDRPPTPWEHFVRDHVEGPEGSYEAHVREFAELVDRCQGEALTRRIGEIRSTNYSIHYHVWNDTEFRTFLERARGEFRLPFTIEFFERSEPGFEIISILRKTASLWERALLSARQVLGR
jgi:predicted SAM-dependent methyltransferase